MAALATPTAGCFMLAEKEMRLGLIEDIQKTPYFFSRFNGKKIMVTQRKGEWVIFSLLCRHKRCTVHWKEEQKQFVCPCHDGTYDSEGKVVSGPPKAPLFRYKADIRQNELWVVNEKV